MSEGGATTESVASTETIAAMVLAAANEHEGTAIRHLEGKDWAELSYEEMGSRVRAIARGLIALGVEPGDRVAIFSDTRYEWTLADFGALCAGAVVVSVYHTSAAEQVRHVLADSGAKVVFCEGRSELSTVEEVRDELSDLEHAVLLAGESEESKNLEQLVEAGEEVEEGAVDERAGAVGPADPFSIIYTSGTGGPAKGCVLSHGAYRSNCEMLATALEPDADAVVQIGLPLAHTLTRMMQMLAIRAGAELAFWSGDRKRLVEDLGELRPTHYPAAPRVFEKLHDRARAEMPPEGIKGSLFERFVETGRRAQDARHAGERPGPLLGLGHALAENEFLNDVRELFGDRLRLAITGAAPARQDVLEFFYACGVPVMEGYGLTETSTAVSVNTPEAFRLGTVGRPFEGTEVRIDDEDGEVLVRGPQLFDGYWNDEEATAEAFDEDGWLRTGDLGSIDDEGYLSISGRKKDLLVTSSGENIPASVIERRLAHSRWISNAVVYGEGRNYLVALITLDEEERAALAEETGTRDLEPDRMAQQMADDEGVRRVVQEAIDEANAEFATIQQVKRFAILDHELSEADDEVTPTMKVRREAVHDRYRDQFEGLYEDDEDES